MQGTSFRKDLQKLRQKQLKAAFFLSASEHSLKHGAARDMALRTAEYRPFGPQVSSVAEDEALGMAPAVQASPCLTSNALQPCDHASLTAQSSSAAVQETVLKLADQGSSLQAAAPQLSQGTEKVLRDLLVQPFADQVVKLMGQGRSSKLSLSEQKSAISKTVDETTVWAVSELTRLQVRRHCADQSLLAHISSHEGRGFINVCQGLLLGP